MPLLYSWKATVSLMPWIHGTVAPLTERTSRRLMYRYKKRDDFRFTFFFVHHLFFCLSIAIKSSKKAKDMFDQLLSYSNHLGFSAKTLILKRSVCSVISTSLFTLALIETAINFSGGCRKKTM
jgi:hypothetical protein